MPLLDRKKEIARLREEGRRAALEGKSCPYNPNEADFYQWNQGYQLGEAEINFQEFNHKTGKYQ